MVACFLALATGAASALWDCVQRDESVVDALFEDLVGEFPVGQGTRELQRPDQQGVDAERRGAGRVRVVRGQAGGDVFDEGQQGVGVGPSGGVGAAADLVEQGGGRATVLGVVPVLGRQVGA